MKCHVGKMRMPVSTDHPGYINWIVTYCQTTASSLLVSISVQGRGGLAQNRSDAEDSYFSRGRKFISFNDISFLLTYIL